MERRREQKSKSWTSKSKKKVVHDRVGHKLNRKKKLVNCYDNGYDEYDLEYYLDR